MMNSVLTIGKFTFKEIIKSKILMNILFLGLGLLLTTFVAYNFTYGEPQRVALDFGIGMLSLSTIGISIFFGVTLISKEVESRTVYMIISRPVSRSSFYAGKILGLVSVLFLNIFLLCVLTLSIFFIVGGQFESLIFWSILFIMLEAMIVLLTVSLLTLITTPTMSILVAISIYICGHFIPMAQTVSFVKNSALLEGALNFYHFILPGFYKFNIKQYLLYDQNISLSYLLTSTCYGLVYSVFLFLLGVYVFNRKNLN